MKAQNWIIFITARKRPVYQLVRKTKSTINQHQMKNGNNNQGSEHTTDTHKISNINKTRCE